MPEQPGDFLEKSAFAGVGEWHRSLFPKVISTAIDSDPWIATSEVLDQEDEIFGTIPRAPFLEVLVIELLTIGRIAESGAGDDQFEEEMVPSFFPRRPFNFSVGVTVAPRPLAVDSPFFFDLAELGQGNRSSGDEK